MVFAVDINLFQLMDNSQDIYLEKIYRKLVHVQSAFFMIYHWINIDFFDEAFRFVNTSTQTQA